MTGQQAELAYTYDPKLNSNIIERNQAQRYDRILFQSSASIDKQFKPVHMEFEGIQHIKMSNIHYPSTHWAIQGYFDVDN